MLGIVSHILIALLHNTIAQDILSEVHEILGLLMSKVVEAVDNKIAVILND